MRRFICLCPLRRGDETLDFFPRASTVLRPRSSVARAAYQDFLTLWKETDPDIPVLKQAKAEYAKLE